MKEKNDGLNYGFMDHINKKAVIKQEEKELLRLGRLIGVCIVIAIVVEAVLINAVDWLF